MLVTMGYILLTIIAVIGCGLGAIYYRNKFFDIKNAEYIVVNQFELADPRLLDQGDKEFKGEELIRFNILARRLKSFYGHQVKVGHIMWLLQVVSDDTIDVKTVEIPTFKK